MSLATLVLYVLEMGLKVQYLLAEDWASMSGLAHRKRNLKREVFEIKGIFYQKNSLNLKVILFFIH